MTVKDWKEYAIARIRLADPCDPRIPHIRQARTWAQLESVIPWKLVAALANRCRVSDL